MCLIPLYSSTCVSPSVIIFAVYTIPHLFLCHPYCPTSLLCLCCCCLYHPASLPLPLFLPAPPLHPSLLFFLRASTDDFGCRFPVVQAFAFWSGGAVAVTVGRQPAIVSGRRCSGLGARDTLNHVCSGYGTPHFSLGGTAFFRLQGYLYLCQPLSQCIYSIMLLITPFYIIPAPFPEIYLLWSFVLPCLRHRCFCRSLIPTAAILITPAISSAIEPIIPHLLRHCIHLLLSLSPLSLFFYIFTAAIIRRPSPPPTLSAIPIIPHLYRASIVILPRLCCGSRRIIFHRPAYFSAIFCMTSWFRYYPCSASFCTTLLSPLCCTLVFSLSALIFSLHFSLLTWYGSSLSPRCSLSAPICRIYPLFFTPLLSNMSIPLSSVCSDLLAPYMLCSTLIAPICLDQLAQICSVFRSSGPSNFS